MNISLMSLHRVISFSLLAVLESVNSPVFQVQPKQRSEGKEERSHSTAHPVAMTLNNVVMTPIQYYNMWLIKLLVIDNDCY